MVSCAILRHNTSNLRILGGSDLPRPVATLGHMHTCPIPGHVGGPVIVPGQSHVRFNGIPLAVQGGQCLCTGVPVPSQHSVGSSTVRINGKQIMRIGDTTAHGGKIVTGVPTLRMD